MTDKKWSGFPEIITINDTDIFAVARPGDPPSIANKKITRANTKEDFIKELNDIIFNGLQHPTGFLTLTDSEVLYDSGTRTITVQPKAPATSFDYYLKGTKYTVSTPQSKTHTEPTGTAVYYLFWDSTNTLQLSLNQWNLVTDVPIAVLTRNSALVEGFYQEDRHSSKRNPAAHLELHSKIGTYVVSGFAISGYTLNPPSPTNADNTFALASGVIADEDLYSTLNALADGGAYAVWYRDLAAGYWKWDKTLTLPFFVGTAYIKYNQFTGSVWQLTEVATNKWVNMWVFKIPAGTAIYQTVIVVGQNVHATKNAALAASVSSIQWGNLPFEEIAPLYKITYRTQASYGSTGKVRIENVEKLEGSRVSITAAAQPNHNALAGLQLAGTGVTYGHIDDQAQIIAGSKTFVNNMVIGAGAIGIDYTLTFDGNTQDGVITYIDSTDTFDFACGLSLNSGQRINEYSIDGTLTDNSDTALPTEKAVKTYVDNAISGENLWDRVTGTPNYVIPHTAADDVGATTARITKGWFTNIESTNMPTVGGTSINANGVLDLTSVEVTQLANIGTTTISIAQWGYLGAMNQGVASTDNVTFNDLTLSGLTASQLVETDGSKKLITVASLATTKGGTGQTAYTDGQLLIGKTDGSLAKALPTSSDGSIAIIAGDGTLDLITEIGILDQSNVFYAATAGDNSNNGSSIEKPFLTDTAAITAADALSPTETTQIKVELLDGAPFGIFNLNVKPWINIDAPTSFISGLNGSVIGDNNIINIGTSKLSSGTGTTIGKLGAGQSFFSANKLYHTTGGLTPRLLNVAAGVLFSKVDYFKPQVITDEAINVSGGYLFDYSQWLTGKIIFATDAGGGKIIAQEIDGDIEVGNNFTSHPTIDTQYYSGNVTIGTNSNYGMKVTSAFIGDLTIGAGSECYIHTGLQTGDIINENSLFNNSQWIIGTIINNNYVAIYANELSGDIEAANSSYTAIDTLYYDGNITIGENSSFGMQVASELIGNLIVGNGSNIYLYAGSHNGNVSLLAGGYANLTYGELKGDVTLGAGAGIGTSISCVWTGKLIAGANSNVRMVVGERTGAGADEIEATANVHIFDVSKWNDNLTLLTTEEITQLMNIGETTTISAAQWGIIGAMNQYLSTTNSVTFNKLTIPIDGGIAIQLTATGSTFTKIVSTTGFLGWNSNTFFVDSAVDMRAKINDSVEEVTGTFKLTSGFATELVLMKAWHSGKIAFNVKAEPVDEPNGQFYIKQPVSDAAIPVLELEQADVSEGFINFSGTGKGSVPTSTVDSVASVRVELNGVPYMVALHANIP